MCKASLQAGCLSATQLLAIYSQPIFSPRLKKRLDEADVSSYWPISNLTFMSKIVDRLVCQQSCVFLEKHSQTDRPMKPPVLCKNRWRTCPVVAEISLLQKRPKFSLQWQQGSVHVTLTIYFSGHVGTFPWACMHYLKSKSLAILELLAFNTQKF